jgi:hypothetical protein
VRGRFADLTGLTLGLAACQTTGAASSESESFCQQLNEATAQRKLECLGGHLEGWRFALAQQLNCGLVARSVAAGRMRIDQSKAAACLKVIHETACTALRPAPSPCDRSSPAMASAASASSAI